jgi:ankyrin repeat protein
LRPRRPRSRARAQVGHTALHLAVGNGREACAALLLSRGADVHARSAEGNTPLHAAALCAQAACVRALRAHGADCGAVNQARALARARAAGSTRHVLCGH